MRLGSPATLVRASWRALPLAIALLATLAGARAGRAADGAWRTFIRPVDVTDLIALDDEIWSATAEGGLVRFERATRAFETVRREPGALASNRLTRIAFDRSGRLWAATLADGLSRRSADGRTWSLVNVLDGLPSDSVVTLEPRGDTLWIGTRRGIALWNGHEVAGALPDGITASFDTTFTLPAITGVAVMGDSVFLATPRGVGFAHASQGLDDWRPANQGLASGDIRDLASDDTDLFAHVGTVVYRFRLDLGQWEVAGLAGTALRIDDQGGEVLAASDAGVFAWRRLPAPGWVQVGDPIPSGAPSAGPLVAGDPWGGVVAARAETLYVQNDVIPVPQPARASQAPWIVRELPDGPTHNDLVSVAIDGPRVYVTTVFHGMGRFDGTSWTHWRDECTGSCDTTLVRANTAFGLMVDAEGHKWVGGWSSPPDPPKFAPGGALTEFDDSESPPAFTHHVRVNDISEFESQQRTWMLVGVVDAAGDRWFATDTPGKGFYDPIGLMHYDAADTARGVWNPGNSAMSGLFIRGLGVTRNGRIWLGLDDGAGVNYFIPPADTLAFRRIVSTNGISVRGLATHGDSVWILASNLNQLVLFDQGAIPSSVAERRIVMSIPQGNLAVKPLITGPDGRLWVGTTTGLKTVDRGGVIDSFTTRNSPLPHDEVRGLAVEGSTGAVWITTAGGLARFDPGYVPPPPPALEHLTIRVYPNPATLTGLGIALRLTGEGESYRGTIHDIAGRKLRTFTATANHQVIWDGRDAQGRVVKPGIYFVRAEAGGRVSVARVALFW